MLNVQQGDHTPYVFISYTKTQFDGDQTEDYQYLYAYAVKATNFYAESLGDAPRKPGAFWIDIECQPLYRFDEETGTQHEVSDEMDIKTLVDNDVGFS